MKRVTITFMAVVMLAMLASVCVYADIYLDYQGLGLGNANGIYYRDSREGPGVYSVPNVWVGTVKVKVSNDDRATWGSEQQMLCVDLAGNVPRNNANDPWAVTLMTGYKPAGVVSNGAWDKLTSMIDAYLPGIVSNADVNAANADAARLQGLVWEIMRDDPSDLSTMTGGSLGQTDAFRLAGTPSWATDARALEMFNRAQDPQYAWDGYGTYHQWYLATNDTFQDLVFFMPTPGRVVVPEIPTSMLAPLGLAVVGFVRRRLSA
ncbi:MAG: hypothetical protein M1133_16575 [Armatimonadetes bacterium]|nr:hypothetical protein [Armatimonadota bacterium]